MEPRRIAVDRHASPRGMWEMVRCAPAPALRPYVHGYTGYVERSDGAFRRRELPSERIALIVSFGDAIDVDLPAAPSRPSSARDRRHVSFLAGLHDGPAIVEHAGRQHGVQVDITPLAARMLLGMPMGEVAHRVVDLEALLGRDAAELAERLHDAPGWPQRFALLDGLLAGRLADAQPPAPAVAWSWQRLRATSGRVPIGHLRREVGWSTRHLAVRFRDEVGLPPKRIARILRFQRAVALLQRGDHGGLAQVALDCGYYDQAHLNRDFRALAGLAPTELLARRLPDGGGVSG